MADLIGKTVRGYKLEEAIGSGGFGAGYRAYQSAAERGIGTTTL